MKKIQFFDVEQQSDAQRRRLDELVRGMKVGKGKEGKKPASTHSRDRR